jgi:esterase/lipase superfamily enzyme
MTYFAANVWKNFWEVDHNFGHFALPLLIDYKIRLRLQMVDTRSSSEYSQFWNQLSKEEHRHARLIQKIFDAAKKGKIFFDEGKITTYTLNAFVLRLEQILQKAVKGEYDIKTALVCAMDYENSLIEIH